MASILEVDDCRNHTFIQVIVTFVFLPHILVVFGMLLGVNLLSISCTSYTAMLMPSDEN
jgi:hypothetical protein